MHTRTCITLYTDSDTSINSSIIIIIITSLQFQTLHFIMISTLKMFIRFSLEHAIALEHWYQW